MSLKTLFIVFATTSSICLSFEPIDFQMGSWIEDNGSLQNETYLSPKEFLLSGDFDGARDHPFILAIKTKRLQSDDIARIKKSDSRPFFNVSRRSDVAQNDVISEMSLTIDGVTMKVPAKALYGICNLQIGQFETITMNERDPMLVIVIFQGPRGDGSVEAAFIFNKSGFYRRQIRKMESDPANGGRQTIVEDTVY